MDDLQSLAADFIQANRILKIVSPLGEDQLLPERVTIEEGISSLFEIKISARAKKPSVKPEELIGRLMDVSVEVQQGDGEGAVRRPFNGLVTELNEGPPITRGLRSYSMVLRPQMWLLSRRSDCRIWMDKTAVDIVETLFSEHGIPAPDTSGVITPPPPQHYSVQWNETDLAYLTRRFEEDGLFYWFSHEDGKHKLHVADSAQSWLGPSPSAQGEGRVRLAQGSADRNHITEWSRRYSYVPGQRAGADWNFETPRMVPGTMTPSLVQMPEASKRELYEYPARISSVAEAERAEKLRMQASEADHDRVFGGSTSRILEAGRRFTPYEVAHPDHAYEEHVVVKTTHTVVDRSYETNSNEPEYTNTFEAVPSRVPMTPHRETKRPRIEGTQVAIVAGPSGEEIHPDQYGRIKLWFPWDRKAKKDGSDTCWVRVAQNWAGSTWGGQIIPRIGMEVMVAFVDGDPDRPLVTGVVPNPANAVPYTLPANKTKSTFRTQTHKGTGFNEMSFEDENGREEIYVHAQRDHRIHIENSRSKRVDNNQSESVGHNKTIEVGNNHHEVIGGNMTLMVGPNILQKGVTAAMGILRSKVGDLLTDKLGAFTDKLGFLSDTTMGEGNLVIGVAKNKAETVMISSTEIVGAAKSMTIGGGLQTTVGGIRNDSTAIGHYQEVGMAKSTVVGKTYEIVVGKTSVRMEADGTVHVKGENVTIEAGQELVLKASKVDIRRN
ncbi:type VI secretion system Rhs element Vgr family protein (plasmid) [Rhizobium phaseoli]|uniref:type VI secretion system tip protein TssI/VgrG n=1 Tax=Rhizobium phaseoli TaxID=396 RepID=UPI0007E9B967|nr:type VI secretion system tip protein TssI/VgrG [Rhizobium phaseoli]ANL44051.1 type VI secretion system Rhs element Vgr family protein [Rhizobium phaseoli]ANL63014.1 type VI secretion system Rhs element Vgr family protein [Rhizobium phaseoli]ANL69604.1 type VI secretion system Rhs element Vgr family protein [Rhizobium phaseoli]ANL82402.1 type VI secretion system Rhs element Vgr family protein [Rhizobium phaseoli]ANM08141.1 type VI secretion system Rhs element Vgr family protein [Rhizobium ph